MALIVLMNPSINLRTLWEPMNKCISELLTFYSCLLCISYVVHFHSESVAAI